ncbi:basic proline-rich protein-like [Neofelis nebulosa]|uniref:basic proline-rich protein-like n=1 Tax=Neofelis nebulosa TaxID=61452 RepID=UPI0027297514|nr:basic proline-rich protein-like [Neofelis nebulosa]
MSAIPAGFNLGFPGQTLPPCAVPAAPAGRKARPAAGQNPWAPPSIRKTPRGHEALTGVRPPGRGGPPGLATPPTPPRAEDLPGAPRPQDLASEDPGILPHHSLYRWETEAKATRAWEPSPPCAAACVTGATLPEPPRAARSDPSCGATDTCVFDAITLQNSSLSAQRFSRMHT